MFSLYRYLSIEYPQNLADFFKATDSFKINLELFKSGKKNDLEGTSPKITLAGLTYELHEQKPKRKFALYDKSSSFLQNGASIIGTLCGTLGLSLGLVLVADVVSMCTRIKRRQALESLTLKNQKPDEDRGQSPALRLTALQTIAV